jgi:heme exporter protein C
MAFDYAPTEETMGEVQRVLYLHVAVAWSALMGCLIMGASGVLYLVQRQMKWDQWTIAAGEVGWLAATLTLITGSLWAREAWGVWWTWEPRLTTALIMWLIYAGLFLTRASVDDPTKRARFSAVLALLGVADIPLVVMATRWFRGMHPVAPEMDAQMRLTLLVVAVAFSCFFAFLVLQRRRQLNVAGHLDSLEWTAAL